MNDKARGSRGLRCAGALAAVAAVAAVALLTAACGGPSTGGGGTSLTTESAAYRANIAFAQCMRTHGVPGFPDPQPGSNFAVSGAPAGAAAETTSGKAYLACQRLLPDGSSSGSSPVSTQQLAAGVTLAQCIRTHGVPDFPDPTVVNGGLNFDFTGVNTAQFRAAVSACRSVTPTGVKLP